LLYLVESAGVLVAGQLMQTTLILSLGLVLLYYGAEALVKGSSSMALRLGVSPLLVGLTVVAFGTSSPELVVSLKAAYLGQGDISVGNIVGSNICNIGLILGFCAMVTPIVVSSQITRLDIPIMVGVTLLSVVFLHGGILVRVQGVVLFFLLLAYVAFSIWISKRRSGDALGSELAEEIKPSKRSLTFDVTMVVVGLSMLVLGARFLVDASMEIARAFGWSEAVIGLTIVAVGTSLPEFATSLVAAMRKEADIAVGNIVGSNIFNILGILGLSSIFTPLSASGITTIDLVVMCLFAVILWPFCLTEQRITRKEGGVLFSAYAGYVIYLVAGAQAG